MILTLIVQTRQDYLLSLTVVIDFRLAQACILYWHTTNNEDLSVPASHKRWPPGKDPMPIVITNWPVIPMSGFFVASLVTGGARN